METPVVIYDMDGGYIGNAIAEKLRSEDKEVSYVTSAAEPAGFLLLTMEQHKVIHRLMEIGAPIERLKILNEIRDDSAVFDCAHGGNGLEIEAGSVVIVTGRLPNDELFLSLENKVAELDGSKVKSVDRIGDCEAPSIIATAVYEGHKYARRLDEEPKAIFLIYLK